ncbi:hypothetical protein HC231_08145 [Brenneria izadpanahii]|uniref:Uncharacterized protein n=1 Tax=Brenneria izadpanahii TaxID=2722756 RepID=A0ABX7URD9_9GAMM|nr:hypothetical protein [Brenneria izadpanahii]QTF07905.1 hypothetical protein HC231_08145 [Brenneria izadpanahii]
MSINTLSYSAITEPDSPIGEHVSGKERYIEDKVILSVNKAIRDNKMTTLRDHCLAYDYDDTSDNEYYLVTVRENKRYAICGGDPNISINLFRFKISRSDFSLYTDAGAEDGSFHPINK